MEAPDLLPQLRRLFVYDSLPKDERENAERGCRAIMAFVEESSKRGTIVGMPQVMRALQLTRASNEPMSAWSVLDWLGYIVQLSETSN